MYTAQCTRLQYSTIYRMWVGETVKGKGQARNGLRLSKIIKRYYKGKSRTCLRRRRIGGNYRGKSPGGWGGGEESGERGERKRWAVVMGIGRKWVEKDPGEGGRGVG